MTYVGAILYIAGLILTDISYVLVDPRVSLGSGDTRTLYGQPSRRDMLKILLSFLMLAGGTAAVYAALRWLASLGTRLALVPNALVCLILLGLTAFVCQARHDVLWRAAWRQVCRNRLALASLGVLSLYALVAVLDSISWRDLERAGGGPAGGTPRVLSEPRSVLDRLCAPFASKVEKTYSAPLAERLFTRETVERVVDGRVVRSREFVPLKHPGWHLLGTDKTGRDVLYLTLKSVRTGLVVGGLTTLIAIPFAIFFGVLAGFFGGWIDDAVQYLYSTLSSIPWVLLVVCFMMLFGRGLPQLCVVMGLTGWVGLCRLLRGETLKLREKEYVQAALALGVPRFGVLARHVVPNLMHLVLITVVLSFSGLVLAEAVLSYIGVGVGPGTHSWGTMINMARSELGRDPVVWWSLAAAFVAMFGLVLPANLFGDALRDALDPSLRVRGEHE
jgi:peptide/nickel transport system permease protein